MTTKQLILTAFIAIGVAACQEQPKNAESGEVKKLKVNDKIDATVMTDSITVVPFQIPQGGWGFDINIGKKNRIHQEIIPVILGRKAFQTREDALKVGENLADKMRKYNTGFPDLTRQELLDMHIAGVQ